MTEITTKHIDRYLDILGELKERTELSEPDLYGISKEMYVQICKDLRQEKIEDRPRGLSEGEPATEAQKDYLDDLGVDYSDSLTKKQASKLIDKNK